MQARIWCVAVSMVWMMWCGAPPSSAAEYVVATHGNDNHDGSSVEQAFRTIQRGLDALEPGDTLTIEPGEYAENAHREGLGNMKVDTLIRARIPGTVLLRGDAPAPAFEKVQGHRFVYAADLKGDVQAVLEVDTVNILEASPNISELEFTPGMMYHDRERGRLYISTSDMQPPERHHYRLAVNPESGLRLDEPKRVIVEGLAATGYYRHGDIGHLNDSVWGIALHEPEQCTVREVTVYLNAGGLMLFGGSHNTVAHCTAYGNDSAYQETGGIRRFQGDHDVIRDSVAYLSRHSRGIGFYLSFEGPVVMKNNLTWGNPADIKGGNMADFGKVERSIALGTGDFPNAEGVIVQSNRYAGHESAGMGEDSIHLGRGGVDLEEEFADPFNFDFRLQATSSFRGAGPDGGDRGPHPYESNVFYVSPDGSDDNDGLSRAHAWRTLDRAVAELSPGATVYLDAGEYEISTPIAPGGAEGERTAIRGRGDGNVVIRGTTRIADSDRLSFQRLHFADSVELRHVRGAEFDNCTFAGALRAEDAADLRLTHNIFAAAPMTFTRSEGVFVASNVFANTNGQPAIRVDDRDAVRYADYNAYAQPDAAWAVADEMWALSSLRDQHIERRAVAQTPTLSVEHGLVAMSNAHAFAGRGLNGTAIGPYRPQDRAPVGLAGPFVHSTTDTTANFEWWVSTPSGVELAWGETPACENIVTLTSSGYSSYSLTGLEPGKRYYFRINGVAPVDISQVNRLQRRMSFYRPDHTEPIRLDGEAALLGTPGLDEPTEAISLTTRTQSHTPRTYHVAPDGDNAHDGLTRDRAWRTVNHAASQVRPGDTVQVAEGAYNETVRVRTTGTPEWPIIFRHAPGERAVFAGEGRSLYSAFKLTAKDHIRIDGFYFGPFLRTPTLHPGIIDVDHSRDVAVTRCMFDGRSRGYQPYAIAVRASRDVLLQNSALINGFNNALVMGSPNFRAEHNVFMRQMIRALSVITHPTRPDDKTYFSHNIVTDNLASKQRGPLFEISHGRSFIEKDNGYYLRVSDEQRQMFQFYQDWGRRSLASYRAKLAEAGLDRPESDSVFGDPMFQASLDMERDSEDGQTPYIIDHFTNPTRHYESPDDLFDFPELFATNPEFVERGIGLDPAAFEDFHFSREPTQSAE